MTVHSDFWDLFSLATTWRPLIFTNQNAPKPPAPFASIHLMNADPLPEHIGMIDDLGNRAISQHMPMRAQVQFYGDGSWDEAQRFSLKLSTVAVEAKAEALNIAINSKNQIQDIPALLDGSFYEPRTVFDLDVSYTCSIEEYVSWIEHVRGVYTDPLRGDLPWAVDVVYN